MAPLDDSLAHYAVVDGRPADPRDSAMVDPAAVLRRAKLTRASVKIHRLLDLNRIGYLRTQMLGELADLLREAGEPTLAERADEDDCCDSDLREIDDAVRALLDGGASP